MGFPSRTGMESMDDRDNLFTSREDLPTNQSQRYAAPIRTILENGDTMARRALLVGIDKYADEIRPGRGQLPSLTTPVRDAARLHALLADSFDPQYNWTKIVALPGLNIKDPHQSRVDTSTLWATLEDFFSPHGSKGDHLLFYFAGHGITRFRTGILATSDTDDRSGGIPMPDLLRLIQTAGPEVASITVLLDCCGSGMMNDISGDVHLPSNTSILTASFSSRESYESRDGTVGFSPILHEGLQGGGVQGVLGHISVTSLVTFIHERFEEEGNPQQQPTFHGLLTNIPILRTTKGAVEDAADIDRLVVDFDSPDARVTMKPSHEGPNIKGLSRQKDSSEANKTEDQKQFDYFKRLQTASLLEVDRDDKSLYWACGFEDNGSPTQPPQDVFLTSQGKAMWAVARRRREYKDEVARRGALY